MPAWTKADYDANYRWRVERYFGGHPNTRPEVVVHYHKWAMQPVLNAMWAKLQPVLNIQSTDYVCVVGAGFGWGVEAVIAETGATVVGIDISDYITAEQGNTEETELRAAVTEAGLDPDIGRGLEVMNYIYDAQPRSNVVILQNDASTGPQRGEIRTALGGNWPSVCIAEDIIDDDWTDVEIGQLRDAMNGFGGTQRLIFVYKGTAARTHQDLFDLLPGTKEVISTDGQVYLS
jgi:hypothetical protein